MNRFFIQWLIFPSLNDSCPRFLKWLDFPTTPPSKTSTCARIRSYPHRLTSLPSELNNDELKGLSCQNENHEIGSLVLFVIALYRYEDRRLFIRDLGPLYMVWKYCSDTHFHRFYRERSVKFWLILLWAECFVGITG